MRLDNEAATATDVMTQAHEWLRSCSRKALKELCIPIEFSLIDIVLQRPKLQFVTFSHFQGIRIYRYCKSLLFIFHLFYN